MRCYNNSMRKSVIISLISAIVVIGVAFVISLEERADSAGEASVVSTTPATPATTTVNLYYYSPQEDIDASGNLRCSGAGLTPVARTIATPTDAEAAVSAALKLLLAGEISPAERARGVTTEFPLPELAVVGIRLADGVATVALDDPSSQTSGGACRATVLRGQVRQTVLQFPTVAEVRFLPETLFQP